MNPSKASGHRLPGAVLLSALCLPLAAAEPGIEKPRYNQDVRPVLAENCFPCHGPDSAARKAELRLDREAEATAARPEGAAIVPGDPAKSLMIRRIKAADADDRMPPPEANKTLKPEQIEILERWVAQGAAYEPHWSYIPPVRPPLPTVRNESWCRTPIDYFIAAGLEKLGLEPAPEADRRALARRISFDLTGLPPEPAEVDAFASDESPGAYERLIDHYLTSLEWGEHRGRYWLDAARYADTNGIHFDNYREMWSYRAWVIDAFNRNLPFDRFTVEQLAGDLLPERTLEQQIASGFNRCNITTNEGGVIPEEYLVLYTRDRTETVSQVWLGMTAGCAVCHDHKFDPLTQRMFYEMAAFFNNTTQAAMDGNVKDTPPVVKVPLDLDRARFDALQGEISRARERIEERRRAARPDFERWLAAAGPGSLRGSVPSDALLVHAPLGEGEGNRAVFVSGGEKREVTAARDLAWEPGHVAARALKSHPDSGLALAGAGDLEKDQAFSFGIWVKLPGPDISGTLFARMDDREGKGYRGWDLTLDRGRVGAHLIHAWQNDALKVVSKRPVDPGKWNHVLVTHDGSGKTAGIEIFINGVRQEKEVMADALQGSIRTEVPLRVARREVGAGIDGALIQDLRIYGRALAADEAGALAGGARAAWLISKPSEQRAAEETDELFGLWLESADDSYREAAAALSALEGERAAIIDRGTVAHVSQERDSPPMAYVLFRGAYDKRREEVAASTPDFLPELPEGAPGNRLGFAQWLLEPEHPLTARVTVNRFWQEVFGTGIVRTTGDFGTAGEPPSHPELLDWLAVEFRESGWDVKRFFKLLLTSAAYRQSPAATPEKIEKDPQNRYLSRGPRFRMDAEMVRDNVLAASGLLVQKIGGPSVKPYQPDGVWEAVAMPESNTRNYKRDSGEDLYRRSIYTFWKRAAPPASLDILNAPAREFCTVRRERTNTPLQALVTLNDPQFVEAARWLAQRSLRQGGETDESRIDFIARRLLARSFRPEEMEVVRSSLRDLLGYYRAHPDDAGALIAVGESKADPALDASRLAAWTMLANQLMNLDEVLNK